MTRITRIFSGFSVASAVTILAYISLYLTQMGSFADDPGVGWHLKTGELIWRSGEVPRSDPFLAIERREWVADQWLSDLTLFKLYNLGGWELLYVTFAGVWIVTFFGILFPALRHQSGSALASLISVLVAFKCAQVHFILRPVVFSLLCFVCVFVTARDIYHRGVITRGALYRRYTFLPLVFVLWSNLHPAFVLGLFVMLLVPAAHVLETKKVDATVGRLSALSLLCIVATLANPYGIELHKSILALGRSEYFMNLNQEWLPPDFTGFAGMALLCLIGVPLVTALVAPTFRKKIGWFDIITTGLLALEALRSVRYIPFAGVAAIFPFAAALNYVAGCCRIPALKLTTQCIKSIEQRERRYPYAAITAWLCAVCGLAGVTSTFLPEELGPQPSRYPPAVLAAIRTDASNGVVLASPDWGGSITAALYPDFRAVIDDRNTLIGEALYRQYFESLKSRQTLTILVKRFGVTHLIIPANSVVGKELLSEGRLRILLNDGHSVVLRVG